MPQTLFDKARIAVLGNMHALLDRAVDNVAGYTQYLRDLDTAIADLRAADDEAVGTINGYKRDIAKLETDNAEKQSDIDLLLGDDDPSNDESALQLQLRLQANADQIGVLEGLQQEAEANKAELDDAVGKLDAKRQEMANNLSRLTLSQAATSAKNRASSAAESALAVSDAADGAGIDNLEAKLDHKKDVADARFERVIGGLQTPDSPEEQVKLAQAKAALIARQSQIAEQANKQEAPATT